MGIITLEGADFFAYHGYYAEERKIGNKYSVDINVSTDFEAAAASDNLMATVNYADLYSIIHEEMQISSQLLENIAHRIIERTYARYPHIEWVEVSISKFNPPVGGICYRSMITLKKLKTDSF